MKGQKINDRYQIIKNIGEGGMANVYLAYDTILDRNVAVKVLRGDLASDEKFVRRFQREALSASNLSHQNIVEVYDVGEDDGQYYIVMEYIEGRHLKQLLKKREKLTLTEVIDIMLQVTEGMAQAHDSYIIHRDIKPQNIMILENGLVKVTDFGIATALNGTQLTQTNSVMGSVHYLPPEQAEGRGATIRSDVYSMGILMYELLTGELPFKGDNAVEIALKHLKEPVPNVKTILPNIPQAVENAIIRSTAKNPDNRYADAREMYEDLKTVLDESRANEPVYVLPYPELENKNNYQESDVKLDQIDYGDDEDDDPIAVKVTEQDIKKQNRTLVILGSVFTALAIITAMLVILLPQITKQKPLTVPDVSGLSVEAAEKKLIDAGFAIADQTQMKASDTVKEGLVIETKPKAKSVRKEGTIITIYESTGMNSVVLEDYKGKNVIEVRTTLEKLHKINVIVEKKDVEEASDLSINDIIEQDPKVGTKLKEGDTVYLYVPNITEKYPDFTKGNYSLEDIEAFAKKYGLELKVNYVESVEYVPGSIMSQSRAEGTTIISGITFTITIAEEVSVEDPDHLENTD
ncbi:MAG: Stk1 family PASTA domain-containing Ser/Thr kinase [Mollicutes bacterium]|jgi:serine/threonine-protein kinase|nr:Stk1 family PASTA domain-containing Ser/Thr kinase [Mollicutes bacterium]